MKLDKIILKLKEIESNKDFTKLENYIEDLESEFLKEDFKSKTPTDKTRLSAIDKMLKAVPDCRPLLKAFTPLFDENKVVITDSYQLYVLNEEYLPFNVAFQSGLANKEDEEEYIEKYNLKLTNGTYPTINNVIPKKENITNKFTLNTSDILKLEKTTLKDKSTSCKVHNFKFDNIEFTLDLCKLKTAIQILKLSGDFELEYYGEYRPLTIRTENELGLIVPMAKY